MRPAIRSWKIFLHVCFLIAAIIHKGGRAILETPTPRYMTAGAAAPLKGLSTSAVSAPVLIVACARAPLSVKSISAVLETVQRKVKSTALLIKPVTMTFIGHLTPS